MADDNRVYERPEYGDNTIIVRRPINSPDYVPGGEDNGGYRTKRTPNEPKAAERRLTTAAEGSIVPHIYGIAEVGGKVFAAGMDSRYWYIGVAWCIGGTYGIADILEVFNGDSVIDPSDRQDYLGLPDQDHLFGAVGKFGIDPVLDRNWLAYSIPGYEDSMTTEIMRQKVGIAYSIIRVARGSEIQQLVAHVNGILVKDYRASARPSDPDSAWDRLIPYNEWENYGGGWAELSWFAPSKTEICLRGAVSQGRSGQATVTFVPGSHRRERHRIFAVPVASGGVARLDVRSDGSVVSPEAASSLNTGWSFISLYLDQSDAGWNPLPIISTWDYYGGEYETPAYKVLPNGTVHLRGVVKNASGNPYDDIATLPPGLEPDKDLPMFCASSISGSGAGFSRVDIKSSGVIKPVSGMTGDFVSLEAVYVKSSDSGWTDITSLFGGWTNFGDPYPVAQYRDLGNGLVHVRGMLTGGTAGDTEQPLFSLPSSLRPQAVGAFNGFQGDGGNCRILVRPSGSVSVEWLGDSTFLWFSFVYHKATDIWEYTTSTNPSLALADHITSASYGLGAEIGDPAKTGECAEYNDEFIIVDDTVAEGTPPNDTRRHEIGYVMSKPDDTRKYVDILRDYANCFTHYFGNKVFMVPDRRITKTGAGGGYDFSDFEAKFDETNIISGSLAVKKSGDRDRPTVVTLTYNERTAPSTLPEGTAVLWSDSTVTGYYDDDISKVSKWKESSLSYPGIPSRSQARRKLVEYMNHIWLEDLEVSFVTFSEAMPLYNGSPFLLKHPIGIGSNLSEIDNYKPFRATKVTMLGPNKYKVTGIEYQEDAYSDAMDVTPSISDTQLPDPTSAATITGISSQELSSGGGVTSFYTFFLLNVSIESAFPYPELQVYDWKIHKQTTTGLQLMWTGTAGKDGQFTSGPLEPGATYVVEVTPRNSSSGREGSPYSITLNAVGKDNPPGTPVDFSASEAGGSIYLSWSEPEDEFPGTLSYEIRIIPSPSTPLPETDADKIAAWNSASEFFSGSVTSTWRAGFSSGTYRFLIVAIDGFRTPSEVPAVIDVKSTSDDKAFVHDTMGYEATYSELYHYKPKRSSNYTVAYTCTSESFGDVFPNNMDTYSQPLYVYHNAVAPQTHLLRLGDNSGDPAYNNAIELPAELTGKFESVLSEWKVSVPYVAGTPDVAYAQASANTHLMADGESPPGTVVSGPNEKQFGTALRVYAEASGYCFKFRLDDAKLTTSFSTRKEEGVVQTDGTGGVVVELEDAYSKVYKINAQIVDNATTATGVIDNVALDSDRAEVADKTDIYFSNGDGITGNIYSTTTDFVAAGFSADPDSNPDTVAYIKVSGSSVPENNRLYQVVSVTANRITVSPAPTDESAAAPITVKEVNTITVYAKHSITGEDVARQVFWFFEGV
jgi:hypothetical protein